MSPIIKLSSIAANKFTPTVREPNDWVACEPKCFVGHRPTHSMFEFYPAPETPDKLLRMEEFRARLVHVCAGHPSPAGDELTTLCREAVVMGLHFLGMVRLVEVRDDIAEDATASD